MKPYKYFLILSVLFQNIILGSSVDKTKSFQVSPGGELSLSVNTGEIRINTWDKNEVKVTVKGLYDEEGEDLKMTQENNNVRVKFNGGWSDPDELMFIIYSPVRYNYDIRTQSGDITVTGNVNGSAKILTQGGDIKIGSISGNTVINTSGGDITSGDILADAHVSTSGGDIFLHNISGNAEIETMGGDITAGDITKKAVIRTQGGDVRTGNTGETEITTYGGDIITKYIAGSSKLITYGGDIKVDGSKGFINAKSKGGDIKLLNITGAAEVNTASGDILVELIPDNSKNSKIVTQDGGIILRIPDKAKAEITANARFRGSYEENEELDITSDFKSKSHEKNSRSIRNVYLLNGGGINIYLESTDSGIKINKLIR